MKSSVIAFTVSICVFGAVGLAHADFVFVKNAKNDTAEADRDLLKSFYTGKAKTWKNGTEVELILNAPGTAELKWLAEKVVGAPPDVVISKIKQEVFKGDMKKPESAASSAECLAAVAKAAGGLCVVDGDAAKSLPAGVQVLRYSGG